MPTITDRIFLCHASDDKKEVISYYHKLKKAGLNPWLDKEDLLPGQDWTREIKKAVRSARFMIIFFSKISTTKRGYVQKEFKMAIDVMEEMPDEQMYAIPVRLDDCQVPESFHRIHYTDLFEEGTFEKVVKVIRFQLGDTLLKVEEPQEDYRTIAADSYFYRGNDFQNRDEHEKAIEAYNEAIRIKPDHAKAYSNKGIALDCLGQHEKAIEAHDEAIRIKPDHADAYNNKGVTLGKLERYKKAIEVLDQAIAINPDDAKAYYNKGITLGRLKQYEEAIEAYDQAIRINPDYTTAYSNKGVVLGNLGQYEKAIEAYDQAIQIKPDDADAYNNKGAVLWKLSQYEKAIETYDEAIRINPDHATAYSNKGLALRKLGQPEKAQACFDMHKKLSNKE